MSVVVIYRYKNKAELNVFILILLSADWAVPVLNYYFYRFIISNLLFVLLISNLTSLVTSLVEEEEEFRSCTFQFRYQKRTQQEAESGVCARVCVWRCEITNMLQAGISVESAALTLQFKPDYLTL